MDFFQPIEEGECVLPPRGQAANAAQAGGKYRRKTYRGRRRGSAKTRKYHRRR